MTADRPATEPRHAPKPNDRFTCVCGRPLRGAEAAQGAAPRAEGPQDCRDGHDERMTMDFDGEPIRCIRCKAPAAPRTEGLDPEAVKRGLWAANPTADDPEAWKYDPEQAAKFPDWDVLAGRFIEAYGAAPRGNAERAEGLALAAALHSEYHGGGHMDTCLRRDEDVLKARRILARLSRPSDEREGEPSDG